MKDMVQHSRALWITEAGRAEILSASCEDHPDHCVVETLFSGISRGTERLVFQGRVPRSEHETMRAPFQEGAFTFPVKYGYSSVGRVMSGAQAGQVVFCLYPHQERFACPLAAAVSVPHAVPPGRAVLAANMETALNIIWDAGVMPGDRVAVVGTGTVGALTGYLAARMPGTQVCLVDIDPARAGLAESLGCRFALPPHAQETLGGEADVAIHSSATDAGLASALALAGCEAVVVEASWYGTGQTAIGLGGAFHQRRLRLVASQVGRIPANHAARWTYRRRLEAALGLLTDPALDALISGESRFEDLPRDYAAILDAPGTLCHRVRYGD